MMDEHFKELRKFVVETTEIHSSQQMRLMTEINRLERLDSINAELLAHVKELEAAMETMSERLEHR